MTLGLRKLIHQIWITEKILEDWKIALLCPVHKKRDKQDFNYYLGITL
jgi:hypothetical protein